MLRNLLVSLAAACGLISFPLPALGQEVAAPRLALVIGQADYNLDGTNTTPTEASAASGFAADLGKPINDADDVEAALRRLRFDVTSLRNTDRTRMMVEITAFGQKVADAGRRAIVVVYYSGHAMQVDGLNVLIPAGARLPGGYDFRRLPAGAAQEIIGGATVSLPFILGMLNDPDEGGLNVVILDSCRNNWWDSQVTGVSRSGRGGSGMSASLGASRGGAERHFDLSSTVIAFSTQPGNVADDGGPGARNSPYTTALKKNLERSGVSVSELLNDVARDVERETREWPLPQRPWMNQAPLPKVCLVGCVGEREAELARQLDEALKRNELVGTTAARPTQLRASQPLFRRITDADIVAVSANPKREFVPGVTSALNSYAALYGVNTPQRMAHFLGQIAHECDNFRTMEEYASGHAYEGRAALGNTEPGDGRRFKGRGIIQLVGRANYAKYGEMLGIDLISAPELAADPGIAVRVALHYWASNGMNELADADNVEGLTRRINGGLNGLADRRLKTNVAKQVFGVVVPAPSQP